MLVLGRGLNAGLCRVREETACNSQEDLGTDNSRMRRASCAATVVDKETKCDHEQAGTKEDERLQATDFKDDKAEKDAGDDGREAVKLRDARSRLDALVERDHKY